MKPILIIDDSDKVRTAITKLLNELNITAVSEARTGAAALMSLKTFGSGQYGTVIVKAEMPDRSDVEMVTGIRLHDHDVPILVTSLKGDYVFLKEIGATDFIVAPFTAEELQKKLKSMGVIEEEGK